MHSFLEHSRPNMKITILAIALLLAVTPIGGHPPRSNRRGSANMRRLWEKMTSHRIYLWRISNFQWVGLSKCYLTINKCPPQVISLLNWKPRMNWVHSCPIIRWEKQPEISSYCLLRKIWEIKTQIILANNRRENQEEMEKQYSSQKESPESQW